MELSVMMGILVGILVVCLIALGVIVTIYVLGALGAYRLAKRRGMQNAWLAWLPVGQEYILGKMSDGISAEEPPYQKKGWWISYPIISGAYLLLSLASCILTIAAMPDYMEKIQWAVIFGSEEDTLNAVFSIFSGSGAAIMILSELVSLLSIAAAIIGSILLYRVYRRYMPNAAMAFAICGGIFGLHWLFLFIIRNKQRCIRTIRKTVTARRFIWKPRRRIRIRTDSRIRMTGRTLMITAGSRRRTANSRIQEDFI